MIDGKFVFDKYRALKAHYTSSYDYFKYGGKMKPVKEETYLHHKDRFRFETLSRKCKTIDVAELHIAVNMFLNKKLWVRDLILDSAFDKTQEVKNRIDSISYTAQKEIDEMVNDHDSNLFYAYSRKIVSPETMAAIGKNYIDIWVENDLPGAKQLQKYVPFIQHQFELNKTYSVQVVMPNTLVIS